MPELQTQKQPILQDGPRLPSAVSQGVREGDDLRTIGDHARGGTILQLLVFSPVQGVVKRGGECILNAHDDPAFSTENQEAVRLFQGRSIPRKNLRIPANSVSRQFP